jgi:hypothetical protein
MKTIKFQTPDGQLELQVTPALAACVASRNGIPETAVTDAMILSFFREASNSAFERAVATYLENDGKNT